MESKDIYKFLFEAPGDEDEATTEAPEETPPADDNPPDMGDDVAADEPMDDEGGLDGPPDIGDDFGDEDSFTDDTGEDTQNLTIDEKISSILNVNLYKNYLSLLSDIGTQLNTIKNNIDIFQAISDKTEETVTAIKNLDKNLRTYMMDTFQDERYENNMLFYNKCKALYKLLNEKFEKDIRKSIKSST